MKKNLFLCAILLLSGKGLVFAQSMAVVGTDGCEQRGSAVENIRGLRKALARKASAVQSEAHTIDLLGGSPGSSVADVKRVLIGIKSDLQKMAYERAGQAAKIAERDLISLPPSPERCELLRDARMTQAWTLVKLHRDGQALTALEKIERIELVEPNRLQFPPSFSRFARKVHDQARKKAAANLEVLTKPAGLRVYVDGCPVGVSPVKIAVPPGEYRVEAGFASGRSLPRIVQVKDRTVVEMESSFDGAVYADNGPCIGLAKNREERLQTLVRLASVLGVRSIVTLREEEPAPDEQYLVATMVDSTTGKDLREARAKLVPGSKSHNEVVEKLAEWVATGDATPPVEPLVVSPIINDHLTAPHDVVGVGRSEKTNLAWKRTTSWSLAGLALVLGGIAVYEQVKINSHLNDMEKLGVNGSLPDAQAEAEYADYKSKCNRAWNWRNGLLVGAGAAAIGAGTFYWLSLTPPARMATKNAGSPLVAFSVAGTF